MRKGATHADWAISLGLFLVYILSMFMILQPGIQPIFKDEQVMAIAEQGIKDSSEFVIARTPIVFTTIPANFDFAPTKLYTMEINGNIPVQQTGNKAAIFTGNTYNQNGRVSSTKVEFVNRTVQGINRFWIYEILSPRTEAAYTYLNDYEGPSAPVISAEKGNFTYSFGSREIITGVDMEALTRSDINLGLNCNTQPATEYPRLKELLNFPAAKEISIHYALTSTPRYALTDMVSVCSQATPYEQANVFTHEWNTNTLNKEGKKSPIRMIVKIW